MQGRYRQLQDCKEVHHLAERCRKLQRQSREALRKADEMELIVKSMQSQAPASCYSCFGFQGDGSNTALQKLLGSIRALKRDLFSESRRLETDDRSSCPTESETEIEDLHTPAGLGQDGSGRGLHTQFERVCYRPFGNVGLSPCQQGRVVADARYCDPCPEGDDESCETGGTATKADASSADSCPKGTNESCETAGAVSRADSSGLSASPMTTSWQIVFQNQPVSAFCTARSSDPAPRRPPAKELAPVRLQIADERSAFASKQITYSSYRCALALAFPLPSQAFSAQNGPYKKDEVEDMAGFVFGRLPAEDLAFVQAVRFTGLLWEIEPGVAQAVHTLLSQEERKFIWEITSSRRTIHPHRLAHLVWAYWGILESPKQPLCCHGFGSNVEQAKQHRQQIRTKEKSGARTQLSSAELPFLNELKAKLLERSKGRTLGWQELRRPFGIEIVAFTPNSYSADVQAGSSEDRPLQVELPSTHDRALHLQHAQVQKVPAACQRGRWEMNRACSRSRRALRAMASVPGNVRFTSLLLRAKSTGASSKDP